MITLSAELKIFLYNDAIDMRAGFERLSFFIVNQLNRKLERGNLFLFLGKNRRRLKCLYHDGSGLVMVCKRLETGRFMLVEEAFALGEISCGDLNLILHGSTIRRQSCPGFSKKASDTMGMLRLPEGRCL
jgi:transposase